MKKIIMLFLVLCLIAPAIPVFSDSRVLDSYTVSIPTHPITDPDAIGAHMDGFTYIHHIVISNGDVGTNQIVSFYELGDATYTATLKYRVNTGSATTPFQTPFPIPASPWLIEDLMMRKSSVSSAVQVTIFFR